MKTKTNKALEGTFNGDVVGGLYREPWESLQALLFLNKAQDSLTKRKPPSLVGVLGQTTGRK